MSGAFDQNLTLAIIGIIVPLWCAAIVAFGLAKAHNLRASTLSEVTVAFGDALAFFGVRLRRDGGNRSPFNASFMDRDHVAGE